MPNSEITPEQDAMLSDLASVVVDELIAMRSMGMTPADIKRLYTQELPAIPAMPTRKRRRRKDLQ